MSHKHACTEYYILSYVYCLMSVRASMGVMWVLQAWGGAACWLVGRSDQKVTHSTLEKYYWLFMLTHVAGGIDPMG